MAKKRYVLEYHTYQCEHCSTFYQGPRPKDGHPYCRTCRSLLRKGMIKKPHDSPQDRRNWKESYGMPKTLRGWTLDEVMKAAKTMGYGADYGRFAADCNGGQP